jgi:glycosyltransferase involved in cell wall biosynthesis
LRQFHQIIVFDTAKNTHFQKEVKARKLDNYQLLSFSSRSIFWFSLYFEYFINFFFAILNALFIYREIKKRNNFNNVMLYASSKNGLFISYILNTFFSIKFIYHAHIIENKYVSLLVSFLSKNATRVICVSDVVSFQFNRKVSNISILSNSVVIKQRNPKSIKNKEKFIVASISTLNNIKGIDYFIDSFRFLNRDDIVYNIYGDGPLFNQFNKKDNCNILLMGHLVDVNKALLEEIDILVVPSIIQESFGMVIIEAMACGVPVIATNIGMQALHVINSLAGELVEIKNSKNISEKITLILSSEDNYLKYSKNGLSYVKKFDFKYFSNEVIKIFS